MPKILYRRDPMDSEADAKRNPILLEARECLKDTETFRQLLGRMLREMDVKPIPGKLAGISTLVDAVRETAEEWGLDVTVMEYPHHVSIDIALDESGELTFLGELIDLADCISLSTEPRPVVSIGYFTHGLYRNNELL